MSLFGVTEVVRSEALAQVWLRGRTRIDTCAHPGRPSILPMDWEYGANTPLHEMLVAVEKYLGGSEAIGQQTRLLLVDLGGNKLMDGGTKVKGYGMCHWHVSLPSFDAVEAPGPHRMSGVHTYVVVNAGAVDKTFFDNMWVDREDKKCRQNITDVITRCIAKRTLQILAARQLKRDPKTNEIVDVGNGIFLPGNSQHFEATVYVYDKDDNVEELQSLDSAIFQPDIHCEPVPVPEGCK